MALFKKAFAATALMLAIAVSAPASADTFTLQTNGGDGSVIDLGEPGFQLFGNDDGAADIFTTYTATALSNQTFNVNWIYHTDDEDPSFDPAGFVLNGVFTQLTADDGPNDQNGAFILSVVLGDVYGIYVLSTDGCCGRADITVTGSETPLPAALPLFATGLAGLGLLRWRRKKLAAAAA